MDPTTIEQLEQAFPDLVSQIRAAATASERARVKSHVDFGRATGRQGMELALEFILSGAGITETEMTRYIRAERNERAIRDRDEDERDLADALGPSASRSQWVDHPGGSLAAEIERQMGGGS